MSELRLYLLGVPRIEYQGKFIKLDRRKGLALAAYLALYPQPQSRDTLVDLLWPELDREHGRSALRSALRSLTISVDSNWIDGDRATIALNRSSMWSDASEFTRLLSETEAHNHPPDVVCEQCAELLKQAVSLYAGDFMSGFSLKDSIDYDNWQMEQREWLRREFADVVRRLSVYHAELRQFDQAIKYAKRWVVTDPLHEAAQRQLMRLYAANGERTEALRQYKQTVELLDEELATPPEDETNTLYEAILNGFGDPATSTTNCAVTSVLPPLPSLLIGREDVLREIKQRLGIGGEHRPVTVIQGWPGVGKSTVVAMLAHDREIVEQFPDGVLWVSLGEAPSVISEISVWAEAFGLSEPARMRKVEELSAQLTAVLRDKRVLLIIDDVWQVEHAIPFRVGGHACAHLITSRLNDVATAVAPTAFDLFRLPLLTDQAALELLYKLSPETVSQYPDESRVLVRNLEGLPLAIHVAGRLLHSEARLGWGVRELLAELGDGTGLLGAQAPSDMRMTDMSPTVAALLKRSTDALNTETRQRFAVLGLFVPKPATFDLAAMGAAWELTDPRPTARLLVGRGLLEPISGGRFQMHALLVLHARSLIAEEGFIL